MPRDTVNGILQTLPGVAVLNSTGTAHVRGGRSMEIRYLIDGIPINNPISRSLGLSIGTNSLEQMEVITGGFNAEHGDAQSGIINLITKVGTNKFSGRIRYRVGQWGTHHGDALYGPWLDPDNGFRPVAIDPSGVSSSVNPTIIKRRIVGRTLQLRNWQNEKAMNRSSSQRFIPACMPTGQRTHFNP